MWPVTKFFQDVWAFLESVFGRLVEKYGDAVIAVPTEVKAILVVSILVMLLVGILKKAWKFLGIVACVALVYVVLNYAGVI